jgi:hypothetical protein
MCCIGDGFFRRETFANAAINIGNADAPDISAAFKNTNIASWVLSHFESMKNFS